MDETVEKRVKWSAPYSCDRKAMVIDRSMTMEFKVPPPCLPAPAAMSGEEEQLRIQANIMIGREMSRLNSIMSEKGMTIERFTFSSVGLVKGIAYMWVSFIIRPTTDILENIIKKVNE